MHYVKLSQNNTALFFSDFFSSVYQRTCLKIKPRDNINTRHLGGAVLLCCFRGFCCQGINLTHSVLLLQLAGCPEGHCVFCDQSKVRNAIKMAGSCFFSLRQLKRDVWCHKLRRLHRRTVPVSREAEPYFWTTPLCLSPNGVDVILLSSKIASQLKKFTCRNQVFLPEFTGRGCVYITVVEMRASSRRLS